MSLPAVLFNESVTLGVLLFRLSKLLLPLAEPFIIESEGDDCSSVFVSSALPQDAKVKANAARINSCFIVLFFSGSNGVSNFKQSLV